MDNLWTADGSLAPDWFYHRANSLIHFKPSTPLNSKQRILVSPWRTLANSKLPPKTVKLHPPIVVYIVRTHVDCFCKIVGHLHWIQRPDIILALLLIVLAFLASVQQRRGLKMWLHRVQQPTAHITTPTGSIPHADTSVFRTCSGGPFHSTGKWCCYKEQKSVYLVTT